MSFKQRDGVSILAFVIMQVAQLIACDVCPFMGWEGLGFADRTPEPVGSCLSENCDGKVEKGLRLSENSRLENRATALA